MTITSASLGLVFASFITLTWLTLRAPDHRRNLLGRGFEEWTLDGTGLLVQGLMVPLIQILLGTWLWKVLLPGAAGTWGLPAVAAFWLNFIGVDYLYYWNHRLLHAKGWWNVHRVHHGAKHLDLFVTSRNTIWTPLLIVYLWVNGLLIHLLADPTAFLMGAAATAGLDLWRHSGLTLRPGSSWHCFLRRFLITPHEHAWHHSAEAPRANFGANFSWWDRLHGTYLSPEQAPTKIGLDPELGLGRALWFPFRRRTA